MSGGPLVYKPLFKPKPFGHGGEKRSAQIFHLLQAAHPVIYGDIRAVPTSRFKTLPGFFKLLRQVRHRKNIKISYSFKNLRKFYQAFVTINALRPAVVIVENTALSDYFVTEAGRFFNAGIVVIPHNTESLVRGQVSPFSRQYSPFWFNEEAAFLTGASLVFAISAYDHWLYSCLGANSILLPYSPTPEVFDALLRIRELRNNQKPGNKVLILGTVKNGPTLQGLRSLVDFIEMQKDDYDYVLAGFDVDKHFSTGDYRKVDVRGAVSNSEMEDLLIHCKCLLIQHQPSSGALTRITEALVAGVPVVANFFAAKDVKGNRGVSIYEQYTDIAQIIATDLEVPDLPDQSPAKNFVDQILSLTQSQVPVNI